MSEPTKTKRIIRTYTDEERREAARQFAIIGSLQATERQTGIPRETMREWQDNSPVWQQSLAECRQSLTQDHIQSFQLLVTKSQQAALDRLEHGDEVVINRGMDGVEVVKRAVSGRDAMIMASIATERSQLLQRLPTSIHAGDDRLERIANRLIDTLNSARGGGRVIEHDVESKLPVDGKQVSS